MILAIFISIVILAREKKLFVFIACLSGLVVSYMLQYAQFGSFHTGSDSAAYAVYVFEDNPQFINEKFERFRLLYRALVWPIFYPGLSYIVYCANVLGLWFLLAIYFDAAKGFTSKLAYGLFLSSGVWMAAHLYRDSLIGVGIVAAVLLFTRPRPLWSIYFLGLVSIAIYLRPELLYILVLSLVLSYLLYLILNKSVVLFSLLFSLVIVGGLILIKFMNWQAPVSMMLNTENISSVTSYSKNFGSISGFDWAFEALNRFFQRLHTVFIGGTPMPLIFNNDFGSVFRNHLLMVFYVLFSFVISLFGWPLIFSSFELKDLSFFRIYVYGFSVLYFFVNVVKWSGVQTRLFLPAFCILLLASNAGQVSRVRYQAWVLLFYVLLLSYSLWWFFARFY